MSGEKWPPIELDCGMTLSFGEGTFAQGAAFGFGAEEASGAPRGKARSRRGMKRPGQWGWRARYLRFLRLFKAETRASARGTSRQNRALRRALRRADLEYQAGRFGIDPKRGEPHAS